MMEVSEKCDNRVVNGHYDPSIDAFWIWMPSQKLRGHQNDCPGRHWRHWRQDSVSPQRPGQSCWWSFHFYDGIMVEHSRKYKTCNVLVTLYCLQLDKINWQLLKRYKMPRHWNVIISIKFFFNSCTRNCQNDNLQFSKFYQAVFALSAGPSPRPPKIEPGQQVFLSGQQVFLLFHV